VRVFAHLFRQCQIDNPRSGEIGELDPYEYRMLEADHVEHEEPSLCLDAMGFGNQLLRPDPWTDGYKSLANLFHQLHSLGRVFAFASDWKPNVYIFARPDLRYLDSLEPHLVQALAVRAEKIFYPNWQHHGGMNDRFALVTGHQAALVYSNRGRLISEFRDELGGTFNGERLLKYAILTSNIEVEPMYVRAERVRSNGKRREESFRRPRSALNKTSLLYYLRFKNNRT